MDGGRPPRGVFVPVDLTSRRPPIERWLAAIVICLVVLIAKPWPASEPSEPSGAAGGGQRAPTSRAVIGAVPNPSSARDDADVLVSLFCLDPRSWLIATVERWRDQRIRVWRALEPATSAGGPGDPTIPIVSVVSEGVTELGWCAPVIGDEKPAPPVDVTVWLRADGAASLLAVDSSRPVSEHSALGELYRPPGRGPSSRAAAWAAGTYVFRYREHDGRVRWFAADVEIRAAPTRTP
jgi:hypothetical protein